MRGTETRLTIGAVLRAALASAFAVVCAYGEPLEATGRSPVILTVSVQPETQPAAEARVIVAIVNMSHAVIYVSGMPICETTSLIVKDARGAVQQPNLPGDPPATCPSVTTITVVHFGEIKPGESYYGGYEDPSGSGLTGWGYHLVPGRYTVQAVLENFSTTRVFPGRGQPGQDLGRVFYPTIKSNIVMVSLI